MLGPEREQGSLTDVNLGVNPLTCLGLDFFICITRDQAKPISKFPSSSMIWRLIIKIKYLVKWRYLKTFSQDEIYFSP